MTKRYDHANEERYRGAIEALDEAGKTDGQCGDGGGYRGRVRRDHGQRENTIRIEKPDCGVLSRS